MRVKIDKDEILSSLPPVEGAEELVQKALENGQEQLFEHWAEKSPQFRETLVSELSRIDWEILAEARDMILSDKGTEKKDESQIFPVPMRTMAEQEPLRAEEWEIGRQALIDGRIAWLIPAGGSGSRLVKVLDQIYASLPFKRRYKVADKQMRSFDEDCAKGQLPITPVLGKTFYSLFMEQALAIGARVNRMPVIIFMLSDETRQASLYTITNHPLFKTLESAIVIFDHGMNPVLDGNARIIPGDQQGRLAFSGNGNGGMFKAMWQTRFQDKENIFGWLETQGIQVVGFANVDNPVSDIILPHMVGSHLRLGVSLSFGVVKKADALERVGMIVRVAGQESLDKIEYNMFPENLARKLNPDDPGRLLFEHGDVNVFLMSLEQMEKVNHLPLCMYRNKLVKTSQGRTQGNKFETFAFHIIEQVAAEKVDVKEILRSEQFMPTKNSIGRDSPATVIRALCTRNMRWLTEQGASVATQDKAGCLQDYARLVEKHLAPAASGTPLEVEAENIGLLVKKMQKGETGFSVEKLLDAFLAIGEKAQESGQEKLKLAADQAYSVLQPGEAEAFVEFSPAFAMEKEDLAEAAVGQGWVLEQGCQVALTGHPTQVFVGENFHAKRNSVFILDIHNEYGGIALSEDRWLTFELDDAGKAEIGDNLTLEEGAVVEIHVHGSGKVIIPEDTVLKGEHFIEIKDGEEVMLEG